jgi:hypothetical protein
VTTTPGPPPLEDPSAAPPVRGAPAQRAPAPLVPEQTRATQHPCAACGATLEYAPGTTSMACPYCGSSEAVLAPVAPGTRRWPWDGSPPAVRVAELPPFRAACPGCGATATTTDLAGPCEYCKAPTVRDDDLGGRLHLPDGVVPARLSRVEAADAFREWVTSRWFAPGALKAVGSTESLHGVYLAHWTYDARTSSRYSGQRGEHYWVTVSYTETVDGRAVTKTRQERRTRWHRASGTVARDFTDVLTPASTALPREDLDRLSPWDLSAAQPFTPQYVSGFACRRYDVDVDTGFEDARRQMATVIEQDCRSDIGGDEQRVHDVATRYAGLAFRQLLLPVWEGDYVWHGKPYAVLVNASTGEVIGDRPYSTAKIAAAVVAVLLVLAAIAAAYYGTR